MKSLVFLLVLASGVSVLGHQDASNRSSQKNVAKKIRLLIREYLARHRQMTNPF